MLSFDELKEKLKATNDIREYLNLLNQIKTYNVAIILAVRDTPGSKMSEDIFDAIKDLGFGRFSKELWRMYVGIYASGFVLTDVISEKAEEKIFVEKNIEKSHIEIKSEPWRNGDRAEIIINGNDFSTNLRGINIVLLSLDNSHVLDSIGYDSHEEKANFVRKDINEIVQDYYDIGIFGWWYSPNYGSNITYYALNRALQKMGKSVIMLWRSSANKQISKDGWRDFPYCYYSVSPRVNFNELKNYNNYCNSFLLGSDQLWNPSLDFCVDQQFYLSFANNNKLRIAYAQSFGNEQTLSKDWLQKYSRYIWNLNRVSVREDYAVKMCKRDLGIDVTQVCDPVFLVESGQYDELVENADIDLPEHFLLSFLLDPTQEKLEISDTIQTGKNIGEVFYFTDLDGAEERGKKV